MKTVFHITSTNTFSGAEKIAIEIIQKTQSLFNNYYICKPGPIEQVLIEKNINYITFTNKWELLKEIKANKPDILHCHDYTASILGALTHVKVVFSHIHNNTPFAKTLNLKSFMYFLSSFKYKKIICVSKAISDEMFFYSQLKKKIQIVYNWVNSDERKWEPEEDRDIDLLFVGRFTEQKNPMLFIKIVEELKKSQPFINALMIGEGDLKEEIQCYVIKENLSSYITIKDFTETPHQYMKKAKIFLLTSTWEGFGLVILEAMLNGAIVISKPIGGAKEIIVNQKNGFLCEDEYQFVKVIKNVLNNPNNYDNVKKSGISTMQDFDIDLQIKMIIDLYQQY